MAKNSGRLKSRKVLGVIALAIAILVPLIAWQYMQTLQSNVPPNTTNGNSNGDTTNGDTTNGDTTNGDTTNGDTTNGDTTDGVNVESALPLTEKKLDSSILPLRDYNRTLFSFKDLYEDKIIIVHFVYCISGFTGIGEINEYQFGELREVYSEYSQDVTIVSVALFSRSYCPCGCGEFNEVDVGMIRETQGITWFLYDDIAFYLADAYAKYLAWHEDGTIMLIDKDSSVRYLFWHMDASGLSDRIGELLAESG